MCCALVEKIGTFRGEAKFTSWLCGITYNACRDLRRRRRTFGSFTEKLAVVLGLAKAPDGRDLHDAMWVKAAIARLPLHLRDTVALVAGEELTHSEVAAVLGVKEATVSWRMHQVRRLLAAGAGSPGGEEPEK